MISDKTNHPLLCSLPIFNGFIETLNDIKEATGGWRFVDTANTGVVLELIAGGKATETDTGNAGTAVGPGMPTPSPVSLVYVDPPKALTYSAPGTALTWREA